MKSEAINIGDPSGKYCMFYSAEAMLLDHNRNREFGTVIAEAKNKIIIVADEILRAPVYLIPKTQVDHYSKKQVYFKIPKNSLKEFEI